MRTCENQLYLLRTHTQLHTHTYTYRHAHTHTNTYTITRSHTHKHTNTHIHTHTQTHTHTHTHIRTHTILHTQLHTHTHMFNHKSTYSFSLSLQICLTSFEKKYRLHFQATAATALTATAATAAACNPRKQFWLSFHFMKKSLRILKVMIFLKEIMNLENKNSVKRGLNKSQSVVCQS